MQEFPGTMYPDKLFHLNKEPDDTNLPTPMDISNQTKSTVTNGSNSDPTSTNSNSSGEDEYVTSPQSRSTSADGILLKPGLDLQQHIQQIHLIHGKTIPSSYPCNLCHKTLVSNSNLDRHMLTHNGIKPFQCNYCETRFNTNGNMKRHMKTHEFDNCKIGSNNVNEDSSIELNNNRELTSLKRLNNLIDDKSEPKSKQFKLSDTYETVDVFKNHIKSVRSAERKESNDLASIQSILNCTTTKNLLYRAINNNHNHNAMVVKSELPIEDDTDDQEDFQRKFRRMKLLGKFPCDICGEIFPNLRALKGHNKRHLEDPGNKGPYHCNMCQFVSDEKGAVVRHMRSHNGDKPYECSLCNYSFTTKANCERHIRNRHSNILTDDVKNRIIYHKSRDPSAEQLSKILADDDVIEGLKQPKYQKCNQNGTMKTVPPVNVTVTNKTETITSPTIRKTQLPLPNLLQLPVSVPLHVATPILSEPEEQPLDLSMKKNININRTPSMSPIASTSTSTSISPEPQQQQPQHQPQSINYEKYFHDLIIAQQFPQISDLFLNYYLSQLSNNNLTTQRTPPSYDIRQLLFKTSNYTPSGLDLVQARDTWSQLGSSNDGNHSNNLTDKSQTLLKVDNLNIEKSGAVSNRERKTTDEQQTLPKSSTKMVIKNGVLVEKKKQQRYRTARPFECAICLAKFTLRSNMERHVKQQHLNKKEKKPEQTESKMTPNYNNLVSVSNNVIGSGGTTSMYLEQTLKLQMLNQQLLNRREQEVNFRDYYHEQRYVESAEESENNHEEEGDDDSLVIDESDGKITNKSIVTNSINNSITNNNNNGSDSSGTVATLKGKLLENKMNQLREKQLQILGANETSMTAYGDSGIGVEMDVDHEEGYVADNDRNSDDFEDDEDDDDDDDEEEEGLVASYSYSESNNSGSDENKSETEAAKSNNDSTNTVNKKPKASAYAMAPNRVKCPHCSRTFPWESSLSRHILTHTGQKPYKCPKCDLLFTTKSNCDRHLIRKHMKKDGCKIKSEPSHSTTITSEGTGSHLLLRNVPERPYKCSYCPSSTFSTIVTLQKHILSKHGIKTNEHVTDEATNYRNNSSSSSSSASNITDLPFKCHVCDTSFGESAETLEHVKNYHYNEYLLLRTKYGSDLDTFTPSLRQRDCHENDHDHRERFPDYANRKVVCFLCLKRFWSAEDLRRHIRTHTGVKPFRCDICSQRFSLKHSMLRHWRNHPHQNEHFLDETNEQQQQQSHGQVRVKREDYDYYDDDNYDEHVPENNNNNNNNEDERNENSNNLIGDLLGIRDKKIIDQVLISSADDAAKILGVKHCRD